MGGRVPHPTQTWGAQTHHGGQDIYQKHIVSLHHTWKKVGTLEIGCRRRVVEGQKRRKWAKTT